MKLEFVQNSFDSIRKFAIRMIRKGKKSNYRVESNFSDAGFVQNSFDSIRIYDAIVSKGEK